MFRFWDVFYSTLSDAGSASMPPVEVTFEGEFSEYKWALKDLDPELPSDWSPYEYLVLEMRASSSQWFELRLYTPDAVRSVRIHPFQGAWIRAAVPLKFFRQPQREGFDLASMGNKPRNTFWVGFMRSQGPLNEVVAIGVAMPAPIGKPTLEIRAIRLAKEDPGDAVLESSPLVDGFGQWILADVEGKVTSLEQLKEEWAQEEKKLQPEEFNYCKYGGYLGIKVQATGFFRVEQIGGRWWFVDPDGHLFFSVGVNCISPWQGTRT